jgi:hypothetical protein
MQHGANANLMTKGNTMEVINHNTKSYTENELRDYRMKLASKTWLYETGTINSGSFSDIFTSKDERKVHKEEKKGNRNYTCRYRRENGCLIVEHFEFGMWN